MVYVTVFFIYSYLQFSPVDSCLKKINKKKIISRMSPPSWTLLLNMYPLQYLLQRLVILTLLVVSLVYLYSLFITWFPWVVCNDFPWF